jgi:hypothetical protein
MFTQPPIRNYFAAAGFNPVVQITSEEPNSRRAPYSQEAPCSVHLLLFSQD